MVLSTLRAELVDIIMTTQLDLSPHTACLIFCCPGHTQRLKDFSFEHRSFTLELPKSMLLADVAVRVMYPTYDLLTPCSRSYHCKTTTSIPKHSKEGTEQVKEDTTNIMGSARSREKEKEGIEGDKANGKLDEERVSHCG